MTAWVPDAAAGRHGEPRRRAPSREAGRQEEAGRQDQPGRAPTPVDAPVLLAAAAHRLGLRGFVRTFEAVDGGLWCRSCEVLYEPEWLVVEECVPVVVHAGAAGVLLAVRSPADGAAGTWLVLSEEDHPARARSEEAAERSLRALVAGLGERLRWARGTRRPPALGGTPRPAATVVPIASRRAGTGGGEGRPSRTATGGG